MQSDRFDGIQFKSYSVANNSPSI